MQSCKISIVYLTFTTLEATLVALNYFSPFYTVFWYQLTWKYYDEFS